VILDYSLKQDIDGEDNDIDIEAACDPGSFLVLKHSPQNKQSRNLVQAR
jgi:hypothetical protein